MQFIDLAAQQERLRPQIDAAITRVLDHGRFIMGPEIAELERQLAEFSGASSVVSCSSGTDALVMALMALGVGAGDGVIVPSFTFASTAESVALLGATPIFVDVDEQSFNIDAERVGEALADPPPGVRPVGVIAVDLFGQPADYDAIRNVAEPDGCWILADAAQSFGASIHGVPVGRLAAMTTTSFFPAKPLGCYGDGGAILLDESCDLDEVLRSLRVHGSGTHKYDNSRIGLNGRLDTIQAAILIEKLSIFGDELLARQAAADRYSEMLREVVKVPVLTPDSTSAWAQYTIQDDNRDSLAAHLRDAGVPTAVYYPMPLHRQGAYRQFPVSGDLAVCERLAGTVLSLPMHPYLTESDQEQVAEAVISR